MIDLYVVHFSETCSEEVMCFFPTLSVGHMTVPLHFLVGFLLLFCAKMREFVTHQYTKITKIKQT